MDTATTPTPITADVLAKNGPRSEFNIERRKTLKLAERDSGVRLLPGSCLTGAGRPEGPTITTLALQAIAVLREIVDDARAPAAARASAATALLDRGLGKAPIQIDLNVRQKFDDFLREIEEKANFARSSGRGQC